MIPVTRSVFTTTGTYHTWIVHYTGSACVRVNACNNHGCSGWSAYGGALVPAR